MPDSVQTLDRTFEAAALGEGKLDSIILSTSNYHSYGAYISIRHYEALCNSNNYSKLQPFLDDGHILSGLFKDKDISKMIKTRLEHSNVLDSRVERSAFLKFPFYIAKASKEVAGTLWIDPHSNGVVPFHVLVDSCFRRYGIGKLLVENFERKQIQKNKKGVCCHFACDAADSPENFFRKLGYTLVQNHGFLTAQKIFSKG